MANVAMVTLSYLMSGGVLFAAAMVRWWIVRRRPTASTPDGMDLLGRTILDLIPNPRAAPIVAMLAWLVISCLVDIAFPLLPGRAAGWAVVGSSLQAILAIDYVVLVPILVWCYISIARDLREAEGQPGHDADRGTGNGHIVWWAAVCAAGFAFQYSTIHTQLGPCSSTPPWLWVASPPSKCGDMLHLNWQGAAHCALRGLDAVLALGLAGTVVVAAIRRGAIGGGKVMEAHGSWEVRGGYMQCKHPLRRLSVHLLTAGVLAVAIAGLHLVTIWMHRDMMSKAESDLAFVAQFVVSTWAVWGAIAIIWAAIAVWIIAGVYHRAREELRRGQADAIDQRIRMLPEQLREEARHGQRRLFALPYAAKDDHLGNEAVNYLKLAGYWADHDAIHRYFAEVSQPYPLPSWLRFRWLRNSDLRSILWNIVGGLIILALQGFPGVVLFAAITSISNHVLPSGPHIDCDPSCWV